MSNLITKKGLWTIAFIVFFIDQVTKVMALQFLDFDIEVPINSLFSFHQIFNSEYIMLNYNVYESEWSLTQPWQFKVLYGMMSLMLLCAIVWITNQPALNKDEPVANASKVGLYLILGGIFGNAFDRIFRKEGVIDFLRVKHDYDFDFIFNIADVAVILGEGFLIVGWIILLSSLVIKKSKMMGAVKTASLD